MRQFWMVWNVGGNPPRHQHSYEHEAITEAERLARAHPGEAFVVLEAIHARKVSDMRSLNFRKQAQEGYVGEDDIPF